MQHEIRRQTQDSIGTLDSACVDSRSDADRPDSAPTANSRSQPSPTPSALGHRRYHLLAGWYVLEGVLDETVPLVKNDDRWPGGIGSGQDKHAFHAVAESHTFT